MSFTVNLKPSNKSPISGFPGVPKTYPQFDSILEIRQTTADNNSPNIQLITIRFLTIDTIKFSKNNVPNSKTKLNYEFKFPINQRIVGIDLPFSVPIHQGIAPTLETTNYKVNHSLQVEIALVNKQIRIFEFPIMINKYDNLPIYRQFNQPITKVVDAKDTSFFLEYSLPCSSIGPFEELALDVKVCKSAYDKQSLKLKKIAIEIVEVFDCRCDSSFIKEAVIASQIFELNKDITHEFSEHFTIDIQSGKSDIVNPYLLFDKQQDVTLLAVPHPMVPKTNNLKPLLIDHDSISPVPFKSHNTFQTFKSNFFQVYYQLNVKLKCNKGRTLLVQQPFTVSNNNRKDSMDLIKWILNETKQVKQDDFVYDSKWDVFRRKVVPKMTVMRSRAEKEKFI